jgi:hypothetical protein
LRKTLLAPAFAAAVALTAAAQDVSLEYRVKAAYLLNFTKFVEWPSSAIETGGPFNVCVAETNPFGSVLAGFVSGETVAGHTLASRVVRGTATSCHVLFIPRDVPAAQYLRSLANDPVLTVGEAPGFLQQGGMIAFVLDQGRVRFEIDQEAAGRSQLKISSRLLRLARPSDKTRPTG